jgi:deoxycytidylate deaminase
MKNIIYYLNMAVDVSIRRNDFRNFRVGSVGIRGDGAVTTSYNGAPKFPTPNHHSEGRLCRKLDHGATVFVARITRNGLWAMSKPCYDCERAMRRVRVKRVYYTIAPEEYGCLILT